MLRPEVTLWYAQSLDGRIASTTGPRLVLSGSEGELRAHRARAEHDAVLVGIATVHADDPRLTVRAYAGRDPLRVVLSSALDVPHEASVIASDGKLIVIGARGRADSAKAAALRARGARVIVCADDPEGRVDLGDALRSLAEVGIRRLLVEGGARVLTSFFRERLADTACIEISPRLVGSAGLPALVGLAAECPTLANVIVERAGDHLFVKGAVT